MVGRRGRRSGTIPCRSARIARRGRTGLRRARGPDALPGRRPEGSGERALTARPADPGRVRPSMQRRRARMGGAVAASGIRLPRQPRPAGQARRGQSGGGGRGPRECRRGSAGRLRPGADQGRAQRHPPFRPGHPGCREPGKRGGTRADRCRDAGSGHGTAEDAGIPPGLGRRNKPGRRLGRDDRPGPAQHRRRHLAPSAELGDRFPAGRAPALLRRRSRPEWRACQREPSPQPAVRRPGPGNPG